MNSWKGWVALAIFIASCLVIGINRFLMKHMNKTVLAMLAISVLIVCILNYGKKE